MGRGSRDVGEETVGHRELKKAGKRKARPGQLPPSFDREKSRSRSSRGSGAAPHAQDDSWGERVEAQAAAWSKKFGFHVDRYTSNFPLLVKFQEEEQAAHLQRLQARCEAALGLHSCCQAPGGPACLQRSSSRQVYYQGFTFSAALEVPVASCSVCGEAVTVHAFDVGCAPSGPDAPNYWVDIMVLELFRPLQAAGLSVEGALLSGVYILSLLTLETPSVCSLA